MAIHRYGCSEGARHFLNLSWLALVLCLPRLLSHSATLRDSEVDFHDYENVSTMPAARLVDITDDDVSQALRMRPI